jgi:hypothetical protein
MQVSIRILPLVLGFAACRPAEEAPPPQLPGGQVSALAAPPEPGRPGVRFDPSTVHVGQQVGGLVVDSVAISTAFGDTVRVGTVRFRGEVALSGNTVRHFDADAGDAAHCFEADSISASSLPRWAGDERRPWFCFSNADASQRLLGSPSEGVRFTVRIERFTIHRGFSDQVNSATLVAVVPKQ